MKYFGVIGDQEVHETIQPMMLKVSEYLTNQGYTCRHGGNHGTEYYFSKGAKYQSIILPWKNFNHLSSDYCKPPKEAFDIAAEFYPKWWKASKSMKALLARNAQVIFGPDLHTPVEFLLTWGVNRITEHAEAVARNNFIPVYNLANVEAYKIMTAIGSNLACNKEIIK